MIDMDDDEKLRISDNDDLDRFSRYDDYSSGHGPPVLAVTKTITTYPTTAGKFFALSTLILTGPETEGSTGVTTAATDTFVGYLPLGATVPPSGTQVIAVPTSSRWVIDY